ncbi:hypothetical protein EVA_14233 [gut metagenome]|uniref:Uncharacterized protein n=1 Tax=gut metagenome TaxID=749906 RepID=J9CCJ6_9ZZZZ
MPGSSQRWSVLLAVPGFRYILLCPFSFCYSLHSFSGHCTLPKYKDFVERG